MHRTIQGCQLELVQGDITTQRVDAVVNAANSALAGGGGVDGAIHRAGGPAIMEECRRLDGCPTGSAVITGAGRLPARHVIHTVGPRYASGRADEERLLADAYRSSLELATRHGLRTVAFPSISTGAYGYPVGAAARTALRTIVGYLLANPGKLDLVRMVLFSPEVLAAYGEALDEIVPA